MILQKPGKVTDRITLLGRRESNVYCLDGGSESVLIGGGMVYIAPEVIDQIRELAIDENKIKKIVILHSHFDHCGIVPFLRKKWPWVQVAASEPAKAILKKTKAVETIHAMNRDALKRRNMLEKAEKEGFADFEGIEVEEALKEGQRISCGDRTLEILEVPGHSSCSIAVYVPEEKAMFGSDSGGIASGNEIFPAANSNFDKYQQSLEKMAAYDIDVYLAEHYGARTHEDAKEFITQSIRAAEQFRKKIEQSLERTNDPEKTAKELTEERMKNAPSEFLPEDVVHMINRRMAGFVFNQRAGSRT
ncbi:MAG: MBL fold metallo-hydrolase [Desulfobacterales bacterium]